MSPVRIGMMRLALWIVLASLAISAPAEAHSPSVAVIKVTSVQTSVQVSHAPPAGLRKGEAFKLRDRLLNRAPQFGPPIGAVIGTDEGALVLTSSTSGTLTGTATFPDGTVRLKDVVSLTSTKPTAIAVVGGTGKYKDARGTETEPAEGGNSTREPNTYRLILP